MLLDLEYFKSSHNHEHKTFNEIPHSIHIIKSLTKCDVTSRMQRQKLVCDLLQSPNYSFGNKEKFRFNHRVFSKTR